MKDKKTQDYYEHLGTIGYIKINRKNRYNNLTLPKDNLNSVTSHTYFKIKYISFFKLIFIKFITNTLSTLIICSTIFLPLLIIHKIENTLFSNKIEDQGFIVSKEYLQSNKIENIIKNDKQPPLPPRSLSIEIAK